jgi:hypothetical protein
VPQRGVKGAAKFGITVFLLMFYYIRCNPIFNYNEGAANQKRLKNTDLMKNKSSNVGDFCLQVYSELEAIIDKLAKDVQKGTLPKRMLPKPQPLPSTNSSAIHSNSMSNL